MTDREPHWTDDALCAQIPAADSVFFPGDFSKGKEARRICGLCDVRQTCLDEAMTEEAGISRSDRYGYRGGLGPTQRAQLDREAAA